MSWIGLISIHLAALLVAVSLILISHRALRPKDKESPWWATVVGDATVAIVITFLVSPALSEAWAKKREFEQREWNARSTHLEHLRPALRADATKMVEMANQMSRDGHVIGIDEKDFSKHLDEGFWFPNVLSSDFEVHFKDFWGTRETLRQLTLAQDKDVRRLVQSTSQQLSADLGNDTRTREDVAYALVKRCMEKGPGIYLEITATGFAYRTGKRNDAGIEASGAGPAPPEYINADRAFRRYQPDANFNATCETLRVRAQELPPKLVESSRQANRLAELAMLSGDCPYTRLQ